MGDSWERFSTHDPPPERPSESDCCGTGCVPCVLDVYDEEYSRWKRRQNGGGDRLRRDLLSATKHKPYRITSVRKLAEDVRAYTFAADPPADGRLPVAYSQHVYIRLDDGVTRPYTPVALNDKCSFDVIVKSYPGGQFTERISKMKTNDVVTVRGPSGGIEYGGYDSIVMLCGGTGVAAFLGLVASILENDKCEALLQLHYSCKTLADVLMRKTLTEYAAYWNCKVFLYLTRENDDWSQLSKSFWFNENIAQGRIPPKVIEEIINKQQTLQTLWLICGNDEFNKHYFSLLKNYDVKENCIQLCDSNTPKNV